MQDLKANTQTVVTIGPVVDVSDGFTPITTLTLGAADEAEILKHDSTTAVDISGRTFAVITNADGYYSLTLTTSDTDTEGQLTVLINDDSLILPFIAKFKVLSEAAYDSLYIAKDDGFMDVNIKTIGRADTQETEASNLETACANYSATRGLTGTAVPAIAAGAAGGLPTDSAGKTSFNDIAATAIVSAGAITTLSGAVVNVDTVDTCTTNTDMRGTDNALLASSAPTNFGDLDITATTGKVTVGTNDDKTGYSISGSKTTLDALNDISTAQVNTEVDTALSDIGLDHLLSTAVAGTDVTDNSVFARLVSSSATADWDTYVNTTDSLQASRDKIDSLNDVAATDIVSAGAITTLSGAVVNVDTVDTCTTNTDMRGTDNALLAASAPTNFGDMAITATTGKVTVGTNDDKTGYSISGTKTTLDALNDITAADVYTEFTAGSNEDAFKADVSGLATAASIAALNDIAATDIVSAGAITTLSGAVVNVDTVDTCTTNTDMRGTDNALLAASAPTNFGDMAITATTGKVTVGTNDDKTGYSISGSKTTLDALNDIAATDIVSAGAITTLSGAVVNVDTVDTCTTNTDMRGTDSALLASSAPTNFGDLAITSTTGYVTLGGILGAALTESTGGRIAGNFDVFFENADAVTTKTVDDVGGAGGDATAANQTTIINHLTDVKGTSFVKDTHSLTDITADVTGLNGSAMRGTDSALLAASAPTNFGDLAITATTGKVTVGTNDDKTAYTISGTKTTLDALNDITAANVYTEFTTGSNEDVFKADVSLLATAASIAALNDFDPAVDTVANVTTVGSVTSAVTTDAASRTASQADVSALATSASIAALNDFDPVLDVVANVTTVGTCTTNTDMRGTDNAFLASSAPTNFSDLTITPTTGKITVGTNDDKTGYSINGTKNTLDDLNDITIADILSAGDVDGFTVEETLKLCLSALGGKLSGAGTAQIIIRAADDSKDRITASVDANGNRSAIALDVTG